MRILPISVLVLAITIGTTTTASAFSIPPVNPPGIVEGVKPSAYKGDYYIASQEPYRKCVAQREARHQYWTTGSNGKYLGTYQMTHDLAHGAVWMMTPELRRMFGDEEGKRIRDELHSTKPTKWARFYWDMAFYTVLNYEYPGSGEKHWRGGRYGCHIGMTHWGGDR